MSDATTSIATPEPVPAGFARRLLRKRLAWLCLAYLTTIAAVAVAAPLLLPGVAAENAGDLAAAQQGPGPAHLLGTDTLGRDVLERLLVGTRVTVIGVAVALLVALLIGVPLGLAAGFFRGWLDTAIGWLADLTFSMPAIVIILVVLAVFPQNMTAAMITLGAISAPGLMRVVRSATLAVRDELYIDAARVSGLSSIYIITRHVLPRIAGPVIVQTSLLAAVALLVQTGLAFLNLVVPAPAPSWGGMVADGVQAIVQHPWLIWPPGLVIVLTILTFGLLADCARDASTERWSAPAPASRRAKRHATAAAHHPDAHQHLLVIDSLRVSFPSPSGPAQVLDDVSFTIAPGETVGVVGESGCGKTATAMAVLGLLPAGGTVDGGSIYFRGQDLTMLGEAELSQIRGTKIGLVSQEPMVSLDPAFRVGSQLAEAVRQHHRVSRAAARARAVELLRRVHLPDPDAVARRYPHELSGGMAQRVVLARALAGDPELLIADEPTTALDVTVQAEVLDLLREIQADTGMAILLVTHDWGVVADICDRAVVMYAGQVVEQADVASLFGRPMHPYTEALLAANPHTAADQEELPTIPGTVPKPGQWPLGCHFRPRCPYATADCASTDIELTTPAPQRASRCLHTDRLTSGSYERTAIA
ncbi:dipeptide/oligopeptide/nickel ABC transporter permease/ATP-binding protein [Amycolatopsis sacchari]|uniref:dipeptide/oligopeptide/nickel ABC transporter permease/ATP-binding protein n=1 Tax=Amycolatopsis sacchari TaxID=115433 RepID=UPI003EBB2007